ncbi:YSIRK-type signal peptide-containing protein [Atopobacter phocae]|uniref:YSIRK-type signal peptide-containing protein n=1 Tax=Atopobacter phocae TaxID=136492 RepID=UPI00046F1DE9|nr:YSIRK-type signal peptide-containing protein [Atopobacter phocae]
MNMNTHKQPKYTIKKLSVGVASCLIGFTLFGPISGTVHADDVEMTTTLNPEVNTLEKVDRLKDTAEQDNKKAANEDQEKNNTIVEQNEMESEDIEQKNSTVNEDYEEPEEEEILSEEDQQKLNNIKQKAKEANLDVNGNENPKKINEEITKLLDDVEKEFKRLYPHIRINFGIYTENMKDLKGKVTDSSSILGKGNALKFAKSKVLELKLRIVQKELKGYLGKHSAQQ